MKILGIETSCDDTAASIVEDGRRILSNSVSSQDEIHARFGGVVPEVACRAHIASLLPVVQQSFDEAGVAPGSIDAIAVTTTPGLIGALLIGVTGAKTLSWALDLPLIAVNHLEAHCYAAWLAEGEPPLPAVSLVASGGHTSLFLTSGPLSHEPLGRTVDDAAGEAFDKVAHILKLGYPGGPGIERAARNGDPQAVAFPRPQLNDGGFDFSFSGLKTAVLYHCLGRNPSRRDIEEASFEPRFVADVAAGFQEAVVDVLVGKACEAAVHAGASSIVLGGGVAANNRLRARMSQEAAADGLAFRPAPLRLCMDNAAMVAGLAYHMHKAGRTAPLTVEASP